MRNLVPGRDEVHMGDVAQDLDQDPALHHQQESQVEAKYINVCFEPGMVRNGYF